SISGLYAGIYLRGQNFVRIDSGGTITGAVGVDVNASSVNISNSGAITGLGGPVKPEHAGGVVMFGVGYLINTSSGVVTARDSGVYLVSASLVNAGTINGLGGDGVVQKPTGSATPIVNSGRIEGL